MTGGRKQKADTVNDLDARGAPKRIVTSPAAASRRVEPVQSNRGNQRNGEHSVAEVPVVAVQQKLLSSEFETSQAGQVSMGRFSLPQTNAQVFRARPNSKTGKLLKRVRQAGGCRAPIDGARPAFRRAGRSSRFRDRA